MTSPAATALARRRENGDVAERPTGTGITSLIREMQPQFQLAMPKGAEAQQLVRDALTALRTIKHLDKCDSASVLGALMTCAQLNLRVGVLGQAWPIPFRKWDKTAKTESWHAQLIIGFQGYSELAHRSGQVRSFMPRTVHENDDFEIDYGVEGTLRHRPALRNRGDVIGFHSIAKYTNGGYDFLFMSREEMEQHRDRFAMTKTRDGAVFGPWADHFEAMGMKTTQRLLAKHMPKTPQLAVATFVDGGLRVDLSPNSAPEEVTQQPALEAGDPFEGEILEAAPEEGGPVSDGQRKAIMAVAGSLGMDREQRIQWFNQVITDREITSTNDLTHAEATLVLNAMTSFAQQQGLTV